VARDPYEADKSAVGASFATAQTGPLARLGSTAEDIAKVIARAVKSRSMQADGLLERP
jgi:hypothetical protein